jgi:transcriptional regulator GlxA family with amidase domain
MVAGAIVALTSAPRIVFTSDISQVLASLGHDSYADIEELAMKARGTSFIVTRLRDHIARNLASATIESCAVALRTSERTLQRRLRAAGTSFGEQLRRARIDAAWQLVKFSDLKIDAIAARVGFGNASRMGSIFRGEFGLTAAQLRLSASGT